MLDLNCSVQDVTLPRLEDREDLGPFVYFIRHGEYMKIGTSINPALRLKRLSMHNDKTRRPQHALGYPELVACVPGSARDERILHSQFKELRCEGEWFRLNDELREYVSSMVGRQMGIELKLSGEEPGSDMAGAILLRKLAVMDRLADEDYAHEFDCG